MICTKDAISILKLKTTRLKMKMLLKLNTTNSSLFVLKFLISYVNLGASMDTVENFINFFDRTHGQFCMVIPTETDYERMVREYEAGDKATLETMKLILGYQPGVSPEDELARWKIYAQKERSELRESVLVEHSLNRERILDDTKWPEGVSEHLIRLYQRIHSAELYVDQNDREGGLRFYPIDAMDDEHEGVRCWLEDDLEGYEEREWEGELELLGMPPWFDETIVFAGIGLSAERFLLACGGPYKGAVLAFGHDPLGMRIVAHSFESFIHKIITEPLTVAQWIGLYTPISYQHSER